MKGRRLAARVLERYKRVFPAPSSCCRASKHSSHCWSLSFSSSSSSKHHHQQQEPSLAEQVRSQLTRRTNNAIITDQQKLEEFLETKDLTPEAAVSLIESWTDEWKKQRQGKTLPSPKPLLPSIFLHSLMKNSKLSMYLPVLEKLIDGIVATAKVERNVPLADLAAMSCLEPMAKLCRVKGCQQDLQPFVHSVNKVMSLYCREKRVRVAESLLDRLEETLDEINNGPTTNYHNVVVSSDTYAILIAGYSKRGMPREAEHVLFTRMIQQRKRMPRKELFDACLTAWEIAGTKDSGHRAEFLLLRHQQWHEAHPDVIAPPDAQTMAKAVNAWVNSKHPDAPIHIGKILDTMYAVEYTDVSIFANVHLQEMKIWSWLGKANQCQESMQRVISHFGKMRIPPIKVQRMYATLITAHVRSRNLRQKQLRRILHALEDELNEGSFGDIQFWDRSLYVAMFDALAKLGDGEGAEALLKSISTDDETKPNLKMYNSVLLAWSNSKDARAAERAEQALDQIIIVDHLQPNVVTYNAVLAAMGRSSEKTYDLAHRGEQYLRHMRDSGIIASVVTYNQAILLWRGVPNPDPGAIDRLLEQMSESGIKPDINTWKACSAVVLEDSSLCEADQQQQLQRYRDQMMARRPVG